MKAVSKLVLEIVPKGTLGNFLWTGLVKWPVPMLV